MNPAITIKKADGQYFGFVPKMGILVKGPSADEVYRQAEVEIQKIQEAYRAVGGLPLLEQEERELLVVKTWSKKLRNWVLGSLVIYFVGLIGLGVTLGRSLERIGQDLNHRLQFQTPDLARRDADLEKFKKQLEYYQPYIQELRHAFEKKEK